jgi:tetratricopeptide (TPR) repeat protein
MAQVGGDKERALEPYLQARATALRLRAREKRADREARQGGATTPPASADADAARRAAPRTATTPAARRSPLSRVPPKWRAAGAAGVIALAALGWYALAPRDDGARSAATAPASRPAPRPAAAAKANPADAAAEAEQLRTLETRVDALREAGNWNVLVLTASEWTRKEPARARAWQQLAVGYAHLRQFDDASDAAGKATALSPDDPAGWKGLADVARQANRPELALTAYEKAAALDPQDAASRVEAGALDVQLGKLPEAKQAFDAALATDAANVDAQCGIALVAQKQGRAHDAELLQKTLKADGRDCRALNDRAAVAVPVSPAPAAAASRAPAPRPR